MVRRNSIIPLLQGCITKKATTKFYEILIPLPTHWTNPSWTCDSTYCTRFTYSLEWFIILYSEILNSLSSRSHKIVFTHHKLSNEVKIRSEVKWAFCYYGYERSEVKVRDITITKVTVKRKGSYMQMGKPSHTHFACVARKH